MLFNDCVGCFVNDTCTTESSTYVHTRSLPDALAISKAEIEIERKYYEGKPVIALLHRVSRSGLGHYRGKDALPKVLGGLGVAIISTSKGIMTDAQARQNGVGGEIGRASCRERVCQYV